MSNTDHLFQLVKSLSKKEKRFVKTYLQQQVVERDRNDLLMLFNVMDQTPEQEAYKTSGKRIIKKNYDEETILKNVNEENIKTYSSHKKNLLFKKVMDFLRTYHVEKSTKIQVQQSLINIQLLIDRNLLRKAEKEIKRVKGVARKYHHNLAFLELTVLQRQLIRRQGSKLMFQRLEELKEESNHCFSEIENQLEILDIYDSFHLAVRHKNIEDSKLSIWEKRMEELLKKMPDKISGNIDFSFKSLAHYHRAAFNYYWRLRKYEEAQAHQYDMKELYEESPNMIKENASDYINAVYNYLLACIRLEEYEKISSGLVDLKKLVREKKEDGFGIKDINIKVAVFQRTHFLILNTHMLQNEYEEATSFIPEIEEGFKKYGDYISLGSKIPFYHNLSMAFFKQRKYSEAEDWIVKIAELNATKDINVNVQIFSKILLIIVYYEQQYEDTLIHSSVSRTLHFLEQQRAKIKPPEMTDCLKFFIRKIDIAAKSFDKDEKRKIFQNIYSTIQRDWKNLPLSEIIQWIKEQIKSS